MDTQKSQFLTRNTIILILCTLYLGGSYIYDSSLATLSGGSDDLLGSGLLLLHAGIIFFSAHSLFGVFKYIKLRSVRWFFAHWYKGKVLEKILETTEKSYFLLSVLTSLLLSLFVMRSWIGASWTNTFFIIGGTLFVTYTLTAFLRIYLATKTQMIIDAKNPNSTLIKFFAKFLIVILWFMGIIILFAALGYDTTKLLAGAGIGGLAVALAAQKSITNVFGAINIILNKPLQIGDFIKVGAQSGVVRDIGLSYLTVTDPQGHTVMIPNEAILTSNIENFSKRTERRTDFVLGVVYATPLEKVREGVDIIKAILSRYSEAGTIKDDIRVHFDMFNAYSLDIKVTYFSLIIPMVDYSEQKESINLEIKKGFEEAGIEIAFPTQEYIIKEGKSS